MKYDQLSIDQKEAFTHVMNFMFNVPVKDHKFAIVNSHAGYGKSFLIKTILSFYSEQNQLSSPTVLAFTGRACAQLAKDGVIANTFHSLMYEPVLDAMGNLERFELRDIAVIKESVQGGIIVDEASMVNKEIHEVLEKLGVKILYVGDDAQLPPVDRDNPDFNVMNGSVDCPVFGLTINHRQQEGSGIADLCEHILENGSIPRAQKEDIRVVPKSSVMKKQFFEKNQDNFDIVICGMNKSRKKVNDFYRAVRGFTDEIAEEGEQVVCLRNTMANETKINNGELFTVTGVIKGKYISGYFLQSVDNPSKTVKVNVENECWEKEFSPQQRGSTKLAMFGFGYALTAHKVQGSQFERVLFIDEDVSFFLDMKKFRYTGVSRTSKHLTVAI